MDCSVWPTDDWLIFRGVMLTPHSLISMRPVRSLLKVMATNCREPDQGESHSYVKTIAAYTILYYSRTHQFLVETDSYTMGTEMSVNSTVLSLNKDHVLKAHTVLSFITWHGDSLDLTTYSEEEYTVLYFATCWLRTAMLTALFKLPAAYNRTKLLPYSVLTSESPQHEGSVAV